MFKLIKDVLNTLRKGTKKEDMRVHVSGSKTSKDGTRNVSMYDVMDSMYNNEDYEEFKTIYKREE